MDRSNAIDRIRGAAVALTIGVVTALGSAAAGGLSDYIGARLSRRLPAMTVVAYSQGWAGLLLLATTGLPFSGSSVWMFSTWGALAGLALVVGLALFYLALSEGNMGSVAPLGTLGAIVPFAWGIFRGERLGMVEVVTLAAAVIGLVLSVYVGGRATSRQTGLALAAALTFGFTTVALGRSFIEAGLVGLLTSKIVMVSVAVIFTGIRRAGVAPSVREHAGLLVLAAADVGAVIMLGVGLSFGYLSVIGVLASFYPAMTVLLAWRLDGERLARIQILGLAILFGSVSVMARA